MNITIKINTKSIAFKTDGDPALEIARILEKEVGYLRDFIEVSPGLKLPIRDTNGNVCGSFSVTR